MTDPRTEADRLRVILESLAFMEPKMTLSDALPTVWEIEKKTASLEAVAVPTPAPAPTRAGTFELPNQLPETVATFIDLCPDIQDLITSSKPIHAIKEVRTRATEAGKTLGLREAKEGVEHWRRTRPRTPGTTSTPTTMLPSNAPVEISEWINATRPDIQSMILGKRMPGSSMTYGKIHAIKEVRADYPGMPGLREAKEGVEEWERTYGGV